ncbi:MAG: Na/Pi cotransporter family protein [Opitutales bacterium]|nr:Na/Pi cotransporter family protein [Opitutales bacterium]
MVKRFSLALNSRKGPASLSAVLLLLSFSTELFGASSGGDDSSVGSLNLVPILMSLGGGLALILYGMEKMASGLKSAVGAKMKSILGRFTSNRFKAAITGSVVTAVIQSSSVTTVLAVGFVSAGLMTLNQSVGVIMGANVGTTVTAQIVAFKVQEAALALIAIGFILAFPGKKDLRRQLGNVMMGLGLVFFGMSIMGDGVYPLRSYEPFIDFMTTLKNPLLGILVGAAFTALVQSSSATTGIVITLASQGLIELPAGISLIFGANVGTCVTALLATIGKSREAMRVALVHVIFNIFGVLLWVGFIPHLVGWVEVLSPGSSSMTGTERLAAEVPRQIANAHTIFNITNTVLLLPFSHLLAAMVRSLIRGKPPKPKATYAKFLDPDVINIPTVALQNVRLETSELAKHVLKTMKKITSDLESSREKSLHQIKKADNVADQLQAEILHYASRVQKENLTNLESEEFHRTMIQIDALERIGDVISNDMVKISRKKLKKNLKSSEKLTGMLLELQTMLVDLLQHAYLVTRNPESELRDSILAAEAEVEGRIEDFFNHQERRFEETEGDRVPLFRVEMDMVEKQRRIYGLIKGLVQQS